MTNWIQILADRVEELGGTLRFVASTPESLGMFSCLAGLFFGFAQYVNQQERFLLLIPRFIPQIGAFIERWRSLFHG